MEVAGVVMVTDFDGSRVAVGIDLISQTVALREEKKRKTTRACMCDLKEHALFNSL